MQPIKTTNAMNPAPAKGIESFPTPVIDDVVISEIVNSWKGDYQPLEYGTLWKDVSHAPNQGSFPEHKLVYQQPTSEDGKWVKRIWVNDRVNQDSYNYAIKYSAGSQDHPIYIRTYIVPRETYAPLLDGTPDPLFPGALLVDEEAVRNEGELDSKYITVTRVYETLPGPQVPTKRYNERGDLETVIVQTVPPFTPPDPDGLLVTGSQVVQEEMGKGVKTTSTVPQHTPLGISEKKAGLLGETFTTDEIVPPNTPADPLTLQVVSSSVEKLSATKARKRTTSGSPTNLSSESLVESPLGLVNGKLDNSIVAPSTVPNGSLNVVKDSISPIDSAKSERQKVTVSTWPKNVGVDSDEQLGFGVRYEETIVSPDQFLNAQYWKNLDYIDYKPIDQWKSLRREIDREKLAEVLLAKWIRTPVQVNVTLPDKLLGVKVYWGHSYGAGKSFDHGFAVSSSNYNLSSSGSSKNSYGVNGDIYFNIQQGYSGPLNGEKHIFFIEIGKDNRVEDQEIVKTLNNFREHGSRTPPTRPPPPPGNPFPIYATTPANYYKPWPYIQTRTENLVVITGGKSETMNSSQSLSASINGSSRSNGRGTSIDVDVNARSVNIPPTLHGKITIEEETFGTTGGQSLLPTYGVRPTTLDVTKAVLDGREVSMPQFPTGNFLYQADVELYKYGFVKVTAITVTVDPKYV
jgi:hypothetical protein